LLNEFIFPDLQVPCHVLQDAVQRPDFQGIVTWYGDAMSGSPVLTNLV